MPSDRYQPCCLEIDEVEEIEDRFLHDCWVATMESGWEPSQVRWYEQQIDRSYERRIKAIDRDATRIAAAKKEVPDAE